MICINTILQFNLSAGLMINRSDNRSPILKFPQHSHRQILLFQQQGKCFYCGKKIYHPDCGLLPVATVDHVQATSAGGTNELKNKVMACLSCNGKKGCLPLNKFMRENAEK